MPAPASTSGFPRACASQKHRRPRDNRPAVMPVLLLFLYGRSPTLRDARPGIATQPVAARFKLYRRYTRPSRNLPSCIGDTRVRVETFRAVSALSASQSERFGWYQRHTRQGGTNSIHLGATRRRVNAIANCISASRVVSALHETRWREFDSSWRCRAQSQRDRALYQRFTSCIGATRGRVA